MRALGLQRPFLCAKLTCMKRLGKTPRFKRQRRLQVELPGLGKAGALERKPYPPGEAGMKRRKFSEYALQLEEKQKVLSHYGMRESQLRRFVAEAKRSADINWVDRLINLLERRIDSVVFRLGFAPSIPSARQMISHGKVLVNGKKLDIRSAVLKVGDEITLTKEALVSQDFMNAKGSPRVPLPDFLSRTDEETAARGTLKDEPTLGDFPVPFEAGRFTSYYNLK
jgi:small subunit ribosomal protein S4